MNLKHLILWGKVKKGSKRGKLLGFPTANFSLHKKIQQGIYVSETKLLGKVFQSVTFIGNAKTFGEKDIKAETYILNFNKNLYGKFITVKLLKKIRGNKKFKSEKELIKQMNKDVEATRKYFQLSGWRELDPLLLGPKPSVLPMNYTPDVPREGLEPSRP